MAERRLVDTNLIVRYITQDHFEHAAIAAKLVDACDRGDLVLVVLPEVLAECVFVLESFYGHSRDRVAQAMAAFIMSRGVGMSDAPIHVSALNRYARSPKLHFVDCVIAAWAVERNISVVSFDAGLRKLREITIDLEV